MGRDAFSTASSRTVWKLLEKVLEPLNVGRVIELVLEDIWTSQSPDIVTRSGAKNRSLTVAAR
jgi:hypothetical protein